MGIPNDAHKVFEWVVFDIYQRQQQLYNGDTTTFECANKADAALVIATHQWKIIISKEQQPDKWFAYYSFLWGKIDDTDASPLEAAKRELLEEWGMVSDDREEFTTYRTSYKVHFSLHFYIARDCTIVAEQQLDGGEIIDLQFVTFKEFIAIIQHKDFHSVHLANDIFRMEKEGTLDDLRKRLGVE